MLKTTELLECLKIKQVIGHLPNQIKSIHHDSRNVQNKSLFVCISGFTVDGHDYYRDALKKGARVIVANRSLTIDLEKNALIIVPDTIKALAKLANTFYHFPSNKLNIFGVTGTNGKTTVTSLIHDMLRKLNQKTAVAGTNGMLINKHYFQTANTTCDVLTNQQLLHRAYQEGVDHVIMEVSSQGLSQGRLSGINFDVAVFTNLSQDHLDYHHTMENYGYAKGILFAQLGNDMTSPKYAVLNCDDPWWKTYNYFTSAEVITYSIYTDAIFRATNINYHTDTTEFTLQSPEGKHLIQSNLLGEFNVYNTLAALASLYVKGYSITTLVPLLRGMSTIKGRMERINVEAPVTIYIDYAHTPDAIEKCVHAVRSSKNSEQQLIMVVGTGGERDKEKRPLMGEKASQADTVILTINDPRNEDSNKILTDMEKGMLHNNYSLIPDRKQAIKQAIQLSKPGDIIVIAGKGRENYQIIGDKKYPHSDASLAIEQVKITYPD